MDSTLQFLKRAVYPIFALLLIVVNPLLFSSKTVDITYAPQFYFFGICCLIFIAAAWAFLKLKNFSLPLNSITIVLFAYLLCTLLSILFADHKQEGSMEMYKLVSWLLLMVMLIHLIESEAQFINIILKVTVLSGLALSFIGFMQLTLIAFTDIPGNVIPYGTLGNRNIFIPAILLLLPFIIYHAVYCNNLLWKMLSVVAVTLILTVIIWSLMRTAILALLFATMLTIFILLIFHPKVRLFFQKFSKAKIILPALFLLIATGIGLHYFKKLNTKDYKKSALLSLTSTNERTVLWKNTWHMFLAHPHTGVGAGNWKIMLPDYGLSGLPPEARRAEMFFIRPENDFIWVFAETGFFGGFCYLGVFILAAQACVRKIKREAAKKESIFGLVVLNALAMYIITASFGFPKDRTFLHTELALIIALTSSFFNNTGKKYRVIKLPSLLFFIAFILVVYKGNQLFAAEKKLAKLIDARKNNEHQLVLDYAAGIVKYNYLMDQTSTPVYFYEGVAWFSLQNTANALLSFHKAEQLHPYHLHVLNNLATCYAIQGDFNTSISYLHEALRISPDFQDAIINLAALHLNKRNYAEAYKYFFLARTDNTRNALYVNLDAIITKTINDSLLKMTREFIELGELEKAEASLKNCLHKNKLPQHHDLKVAIIRKRQQLEAAKKQAD